MLNKAMRYAIVFLLTGIMLVSAARTFSATPRDFKTTRGVFTSDGLSISNCDNPSDPQYSIVVLKLKYPRDYCTGQMDVYYSYYDFSSGKYTDEEKLCIIGSDENCDARMNIWFGGKGEDTVSLDEWIRLKAVCRKDNEEYEYSIPMKITHTPANYESEMFTKIQDAEAMLNSAKAELDNCECCDKNLLNDVESHINELKQNLSRCDFSGMELSITNAKNDAESIKQQIKETVCESEHNEGMPSTGQVVENIGQVVENVQTQQTETENQNQGQSICPLTALMLMAISMIGIAKIRK